jgi:hypothetical protein
VPAPPHTSWQSLQGLSLRDYGQGLGIRGQLLAGIGPGRGHWQSLVPVPSQNCAIVTILQEPRPEIRKLPRAPTSQLLIQVLGLDPVSAVTRWLPVVLTPRPQRLAAVSESTVITITVVATALSGVRTGFPLKGVACRLGSSIIKAASPEKTALSGIRLVTVIVTPRIRHCLSPL